MIANLNFFRKTASMNQISDGNTSLLYKINSASFLKETPVEFSIFPEEKYLLYGNYYLDIIFKG